MAPIATTNDPKMAQAGVDALNHRSDASYYSNLEIEKRKLFQIWKDTQGSETDKVRQMSQEVYTAYNTDESCLNKSDVERAVLPICKYFAKLYRKFHRCDKKILNCHSHYFRKPFKLPSLILSNLPSTSQGRTPICFRDSSDILKRRKTANLRRGHSASKLAYATQMKLREKGSVSAAKLVKEATMTTPTRASKMLASWRNSQEKQIVQYSDREALALIIDANFTKSQYLKMQGEAKNRNVNLCPSYNKIVIAKKECYPDDQFIMVDEKSAEVKLQPLLDHTSNRIVLANKDRHVDFSDDELEKVILLVKWGFDGSSGHSEYKQKFENDDGESSDSSMFITSIVPVKAEANGKLLFQNPRPSSTRFCRPVRIQLISETSEVSIDEKKYIENQINQLTPTEITVDGRTIIVCYEMVLTMVDGKVCNAVTGNKSSKSCYICKATPKQMNDLGSVTQREENSATFQFGLSTLHAWIRFMEYFLHLSYRLDIKKWQVRGKDGAEMKIRKKEIQKRFKVEIGLIVDKPKPGGSGTSNDGNTARRFFSNANKPADITGLDVTALERCAAILQVLASGCKINIKRFSTYCLETARYLVQLYPWYYMPASVHKILIHGAQVISHFNVPIGQLSEEAQESRNKDLKRYRRDHARKCSRTILNLDLIRRLLVSSDPLISSMRKIPKKETKTLSQDAKFMLAIDDPVDSDSENDNDTFDDFEI